MTLTKNTDPQRRGRVEFLIVFSGSALSVNCQSILGIIEKPQFLSLNRRR